MRLVSSICDVGELVQVLAVHDGVDRQRQLELTRPSRGFEFLFVRVPQSGDAVGDGGLVALKTDLHVAKPGIGQRGKFILRQQHR
jgi:hypothetical protein